MLVSQKANNEERLVVNYGDDKNKRPVSGACKQVWLLLDLRSACHRSWEIQRLSREGSVQVWFKKFTYHAEIQY